MRVSSMIWYIIFELPFNLKRIHFEFLFAINTRDHIITALPVLESLDKIGKKILIVTFKGVYSEYKEEFDRLENAEIVFFEYELKNLSLRGYQHILKETKDKLEILKSYNIDKAVKAALLEDLNYIKFHIKTELIQYHFFKTVFGYFDLKGVVSIVFTTAFEVAKEKNVATFILQHGIGGEDAWPYISDYFFAYDEATKTNLKELLDDTVEILPLGAPRFEYLARWSKNLKRSDFNKKISKPVSTKNITYISVGTEGFETKELFLVLKKLRQKLPTDVNLIIKLHPRGKYNTKKEIKKIFSKEELSGTVFIKKEIDFYELLANSNVIITTLSTGMPESIAMDISVLQVNFTGQPYPKQTDLSSFGWKEPINDSEIMINEMLSILSDKRRCEEVIEKQRWLKNRMLKNFDSCGEAIAEAIVSICKDEMGK